MVTFRKISHDFTFMSGPGQGLNRSTLLMDQPFNLEFQFGSDFSLEFQPKFGIQLGIPILKGIKGIVA